MYHFYSILFISQCEAASELWPASHSVNRRIVSFLLKMPKTSAVWDYFDETDNREKIRCKIGNCKEVLIVGESRSTYNPDPEKSDPVRTLRLISSFTRLLRQTARRSGILV